MRKNFGAKPITYPQPVFIIASYDKEGVPDAMNAAWGGISEAKEVSICIGENHKTRQNIMERKAFTVSMGDVAHVAACDYIGITSAYQVPDKFERAGFHAIKSELVDAPLIEELPIALECRLKSYDPDTRRIVGEIVNVSIDERVLEEDGRINIEKAAPITFDTENHVYLRIGEKVADAFSVGKIFK